MEVVGAVVNGELVFLAIEGKLTVLDAVTVAADKCAEEGLGRCYYLVDRVVTLYYIALFAVAVGHHDGEQCTAIVGECYLVTQLVGEDVQIGLLSVDIFLKVGLLQARHVVWITYV